MDALDTIKQISWLISGEELTKSESLMTLDTRLFTDPSTLARHVHVVTRAFPSDPWASIEESQVMAFFLNNYVEFCPVHDRKVLSKF